MFGPVASVCRRWSHLSAPNVSSRWPRRPQSRGQRHSPPGSLSLALIVFSAPPPLLRCSCHGISGRAAPPSALPASPRHRCRVGCSCRASVSPHCLLCRELTSPEFRHGHRCRGQGSVVQHFFSFLLQKPRLVMLMLVGVLFRPVSDQRRQRSAAHNRRAAIREGNVPRVR